MPFFSFPPLGVLGMLVKYCDLFHLAPHFAEESRGGRAILPAFLRIPYIVLAESRSPLPPAIAAAFTPCVI